MNSVDVAARPPARWIADRLWGAQAVLAVCVAGLCYLFRDAGAAYSALLGGAICAFGTWMFAGIMFTRRADTPRGMLFAMYLGKAAQVTWTLVAFLLSFWLLELNAATFFLAYVLSLTMNWLVLLLPEKQHGEVPPEVSGEKHTTNRTHYTD